MAVFARGYRTYAGGFGARLAALTIFRQGYSHAFRSKGFRFIGILFLLWFTVWAITLYVALQTGDFPDRRVRRMPTELQALENLRITLARFYGIGITILSALAAMLVGSGLVSNDLRTRALPLYLVRPIRPIDYVVGKALVVPGILFWLALLPGLCLYLLTGLWQSSAKTFDFLADNVDVALDVVRHYVTAAASYTGLMLFLSSRTPRRGAVIGWAAGVVFIGTMFAGIGAELRGGIGDVLRTLSLPMNSVAHLILESTREDRVERVARHIADPAAALVIALVLLGLGMVFTWRRAMTVEVSE